MTAEDIANVLGGRRAGASWMARCPAHNDREPSLSIRQAEDGTVLVRCHAGCEQARVITALRSLAANGPFTTSRSASTTKIADSVAPLEFAFIWKRT
jgi:type II secretory pathway predicted ATPase ExeA